MQYPVPVGVIESFEAKIWASHIMLNYHEKSTNAGFILQEVVQKYSNSKVEPHKHTH